MLQRAHQAGVERILNPGIDLATSQAALRLAEKFPPVFAAVGVHPNQAGSWDEQAYLQLQELAGNARVVAVGEIGLDFYRQHAARELQEAVFLQQLELAAGLELPVVIHTRSPQGAGHPALQAALQLLESPTVKGRLTGVFHSYSGDLGCARRAVELGFYLGIGGPLTYKSAGEFQQLVAELPIETLLVETDAPFLPPQPYRGQRNEPAHVRLVAEKIADLQVKSFDEVAHISTRNATRLFQW